MKKTWTGAVCLALAAGIWGGMYVVSKYVLDYIPPFTLVWLRFAIAAAVLFLLLHVMKKGKEPKYTKSDYFIFAKIGFIGYFVSITCQFIGTKLSDAHTGALITSATPAFVVLFARMILNEKITARKMISVFLATIGVLIVIGLGDNHDASISGSLFLVLAAVTWALLSVYVKIASRRFSSLTITAYAILFAVLFTFPFMIWELNVQTFSNLNPLVIGGVLYLGIVSTAGAFFLWNKGMELLDAGSGSLFFFFQPLTGAFFGWLLLNEELNLSFFLGGVFIIAGVFLVSFKKE